MNDIYLTFRENAPYFFALQGKSRNKGIWRILVAQIQTNRTELPSWNGWTWRLYLGRHFQFDGWIHPLPNCQTGRPFQAACNADNRYSPNKYRAIWAAMANKMIAITALIQRLCRFFSFFRTAYRNRPTVYHRNHSSVDSFRTSVW